VKSIHRSFFPFVIRHSSLALPPRRPDRGTGCKRRDGGVGAVREPPLLRLASPLRRTDFLRLASALLGGRGFFVVVTEAGLPAWQAAGRYPSIG